MLHRRLQARHVSMIALGGSIGTGIFLGSGYAIALAGSVGALICYAIISVMVYSLLNSLGEMAAFLPTTGSFCEYSSLYVNRPFGCAVTVNYWLNWAITIAAELAAAAIIIQYWLPHIPGLWIAGILFILILGSNLFSVRIYGETEYVMSFVKVGIIVAFIVLGIVLLFSATNLDTRFDQLHETMFQQGWSGFLAVFLIAGFAFQGAELIGISAGETQEPEKNIPRAVKAVFWRLLLFYLLTTLLIGLLLPANDPALMSDGDVRSSPFTLVFQHYLGAGFAADFINAVVLLAIISASNASMYAATRTLWYMGDSGQVPKIFAVTTSRGVPVPALLATALVGLLVYMLSYLGKGGLFTVLVNFSSVCGLLAWFGIALSHYCFRRFHLQGDDEQRLIYKAPWFPYAPIFAMILITFIIVGNMVIFDGTPTWIDYCQHFGALGIFLLVMAWTYLRQSGSQQPSAEGA